MNVSSKYAEMAYEEHTVDKPTVARLQRKGVNRKFFGPGVYLELIHRSFLGSYTDTGYAVTLIYFTSTEQSPDPLSQGPTVRVI